MKLTTSKTKSKVRQLVIISMLSSISIFLGVSGLGFIALPAFKLTIMHIPVIIGGILEGPIVGAIVGLIFGLFSMYQNFTAPGPTSFIFWNPIIALTPRILIGLVAYYIYTSIKNRIQKQSISIAISAICASLVNTVCVLSMTYFFYMEKYAERLSISKDMVGSTLLGIGVINGVPEAIFSALVCIPLITSLKKIQN